MVIDLVSPNISAGAKERLYIIWTVFIPFKST